MPLNMLVPMNQFVDFVFTAGPSRVRAVRSFKEGAKLFVDFYKPIRERIVNAHEKGLDVHESLSDFLAERVDPREKRIFPKIAQGYRKFLRGSKVTWFEPPLRDYPIGPLSVRVSPELGLLMGDKPYMTAMYFRGDPLSPQRVMVINELMGMAFAATWPGVTFSVLDVRRGRIFPHRPKSEIVSLLRAEAACFANLHAAL